MFLVPARNRFCLFSICCDSLGLVCFLGVIDLFFVLLECAESVMPDLSFYLVCEMIARFV